MLKNNKEAAHGVYDYIKRRKAANTTAEYIVLVKRRKPNKADRNLYHFSGERGREIIKNAVY